jgi:hypothetical protein
LANLNEKEYKVKFSDIVDKSCLCVGLGAAALIVNELDTKKEGPCVSICPGPNLVYYSRLYSLD